MVMVVLLVVGVAASVWADTGKQVPKPEGGYTVPPIPPVTISVVCTKTERSQEAALHFCLVNGARQLFNCTYIAWDEEYATQVVPYELMYDGQRLWGVAWILHAIPEVYHLNEAKPLEISSTFEGILKTSALSGWGSWNWFWPTNTPVTVEQRVVFDLP